MSNVVNKLIFNCLVQYGNVALPKVGSLQVEGSPKKVSFSTKISDNHIPVTDIIAEQGNMSDEQAAALYGDWLDSAKGDEGAIKIEGVGVILPQSFQIADELRRALGADEQVVTLKKRCRCGWLWWVVAVVAIAAVAIFALCPCCNKCCSKGECEVVVEAEAPAVVEPEVVVEPAKPVANPPAADKRYNVTVGVFSIKYNARACAKQDPLGIGAENYTIAPFPSGMWAVIAYSTNNLNEAERMRKEYKKIQSDVWVYKRY